MMRKACLRILMVSLIGLGLLTACSDGGESTDTASGGGEGGGQTVVIGSTNFPEQLILAHIYADVLEARGIKVERRLNLGSREIVFPALKAGEIDALPEYTGALLAYLGNGESEAQTEEEVLQALKEQLPEGIVMLEPAAAQDKDALVVTQETAEKYDLQTLSDLKPVAPELVVGGPPEMKTRAVGLPGFKAVYGVEFKEFRALDAGGPLTVGALESGDIDVARMFTTQGVIDAKGWVVLEDDKKLVPAQNLVPVIREEVLTDEIRSALNAVSAELTTKGLQRMNKQVIVDKTDPAVVAEQWVKTHDLGKPAAQ